MLKGLSRLWWRGVKRVGKAQENQRKKFLKSLLVRPTPAKTPRAKIAASKRSSVSVKPNKPKPITPPPLLPGKWLASYYTSFSDDRRLPARRMNYWLYLPNSASATTLPLVVMMHGCRQTATQFSLGTRMNALAEEKGFAVLYPQQSLRGDPNRCWHWYDRATQKGGGDVQLIDGIIEAVIEKYAFDQTRIYIAGLSAGAAMAHILALTNPQRIAAVGLHSGPVFGAGHTGMGAYAVMQGGSVKAAGAAMENLLGKSDALPKIPAILIQGGADRVVRPVNQVQLTQQFKTLNRLDAENAVPVVIKAATGAGRKNVINSYRIQDYVAGKKVLLRVCEIGQLEHAWSGGDCALQFNACAGPDASKMMWNFFARHRRAGIASV